MWRSPYFWGVILLLTLAVVFTIVIVNKVVEASDPINQDPTGSSPIGRPGTRQAANEPGSELIGDWISIPAKEVECSISPSGTQCVLNVNFTITQTHEIVNATGLYSNGELSLVNRPLQSMAVNNEGNLVYKSGSTVYLLARK